MYTGLLHSHRLVVILFLLLYVVKWVLLLANKKELLDRVSKATRIPEMIISTLFLLTGIGLAINIAELTPMFWVKLLLVLGSIPLAVIGFRKSNKLLATLSILLIVGAYGLAEMNKIGVEATPLATTVVSDATAANYDAAAHGEALYVRNCVVCHGPNGDMQGSGAKNLIISQLSDAEMRSLIQNGKNTMPAYGELYQDAEINAVIAYVKTLRK